VFSKIEIQASLLGSSHCPEVELKVTATLLSSLILWAKTPLGTSVGKPVKISQADRRSSNE